MKPARAPSPLLCTLAAGGTGAPLFLVPSVGTTPLSLVRLARAVVPHRPVHAFAYAGMDEDDAPPHASFSEMARAYADDIVARAPQGPYLIGGHCLGGTVALEIALELESRGAPVARLCVLDAFAPPLGGDPDHYGDGRPETLAEVTRQLRRVVEELLERAIASSALLGEDGQRRLHEVLRAHAHAALAYRARPVHASMHVLRTASCPDVVLDNWEKIAAGGVTRHAIPGETFSMLRPPHVEAVGRTLAAVLEGVA